MMSRRIIIDDELSSRLSSYKKGLSKLGVRFYDVNKDLGWKVKAKASAFHASGVIKD
jgi:hypothetical protein